MPAHKSQHFVPRCALKPFTLDGAGAAINLFNIRSERAIQNAPVKGQCARDYLYGKEDLAAETILMRLEGQYSRIVAALHNGDGLASGDDEWLQIFILFQLRRTELAIEQLRSFGESMADTVFARAPEQRPHDDRKDAQLMHESLKHAASFLKYVRDLKVAIFRNKTDFDFITCDNPAALTNRFHFQKLKTAHFGISSLGTILSMPIGPRLSAICYDTGVYSIPNASGTPYIDLTQNRDIDAINDLQFLYASKNIYFSRWQESERVKLGIHAVAGARTQIGHVSTIYIRDENKGHAAQGHTAIIRNPKTGQFER
jgi:hypothetical protein